MDRDTETILVVTAQALRFATNHPYAATGIFGAAVGSAITYKVLTFNRPKSNGIFTPKVYRVALSHEDLRHLLDNPTNELKWETPEVSVVITSEEPEPIKELPVVEYKTE